MLERVSTFAAGADSALGDDERKSLAMDKVLIVDDEIDARELIVHGLARKGFATFGACDGEDACAKLDGSFQAIITDLVMPRLDGLSLLARVPELNPGAIIIVITSFADKERAIAALNLGADYMMEKPCTTQQLAEALRLLLGARLTGATTRTQRILETLPFTPREREVVSHLLKGCSNKQIAELMEVREQSVKNYLHQLYVKLGISSRSELFHILFPL